MFFMRSWCRAREAREGSRVHKASEKGDLSTGEALAGTPSRTIKSTYTRRINTAHGHATLGQVERRPPCNSLWTSESCRRAATRGPAVFRGWYVIVAAQHASTAGCFPLRRRPSSSTPHNTALEHTATKPLTAPDLPCPCALLADRLGLVRTYTLPSCKATSCLAPSVYGAWSMGLSK